MTRDDIIRVAQEAGLPLTWISEYGVRLAGLVAAAEREACARVCDKRAADYRMGFEEKYEAQACAYDIRARSEA